MVPRPPAQCDRLCGKRSVELAKLATLCEIGHVDCLLCFWSVSTQILVSCRCQITSLKTPSVPVGVLYANFFESFSHYLQSSNMADNSDVEMWTIVDVNNAPEKNGSGKD